MVNVSTEYVNFHATVLAPLSRHPGPNIYSVNCNIGKEGKIHACFPLSHAVAGWRIDRWYFFEIAPVTKWRYTISKWTLPHGNLRLFELTNCTLHWSNMLVDIPIIYVLAHPSALEVFSVFYKIFTHSAELKKSRFFQSKYFVIFCEVRLQNFYFLYQFCIK